jgi:1-acyl-sn-glycerol-3-phosphate acyltransferase
VSGACKTWIPKRTYIFMVNHQSNIDIPVLSPGVARFSAALDRQKRTLARALFRLGHVGRKAHRGRSSGPAGCGAQPGASEGSARRRSLNCGFSRGNAQPGRETAAVQKGGFLLAVETQTTIVPVTINGSAHVLPAGGWRLRPGTIEVIVDKPVPIEGFRPGSLRHLSEQVRNRIAANLKPAPTSSPASSSASEPCC